MGLGTSRPIMDQKVRYVEERCTDLRFPSNLQSGRHSFIVVTTESGELIKYELTPSGRCEVDYEYLDWTPSETFRKSTPDEEITVKQATMIFDSTYREKYSETGALDCHSISKYSLRLSDKEKKDYSVMYSCQHAARDLFNEICGTGEDFSRNDYLLILGRIAKKASKQNFARPDLCHNLIQSTVFTKPKKKKSGFPTNSSKLDHE